MGLSFDKDVNTYNQDSTQSFDIVEVKEQLSKDYVNSAEVDSIVSTIDVYNISTITDFGSKAAEEISRCSDTVLNSINMNQVNDSGELLEILGKIMDKFDLDEVASNKKGIFDKIFGNLKKEIDKLLNKYHTMGEEIDKVFVKLKQYEFEINESNNKLETMFHSNVGFYKELVKYILAGEQGVKEIDDYIVNMTAEFEKTGDNALKFDIDNLQQARNLLEQRTQDLRIAENIAIQSIPMIKTMQFSNLNLIRKINSAFIITLPVFKQALTQAILLKRQKIQAEAISALDERTNEMLLKNAQNTAEQSKMTARLASGNIVKIETLEKTWQTIVNGIEETKAIQENASKQRESDIQRLNSIKNDFIQRFGN